MHPSQRLRSTSSRLLEGKTIVLGVSGSISAVRTVELARELLRHGATVVPVMTREAQRIIHPNALEFATGMKPITELTGAVEHVALMGVGAGRADLLLIAPATGNTLSKMAVGIDDSPVTTFFSTGFAKVPVLVAPAMHETMLQHPFLTENIERLKRAGVHFVDPVMEEGKAKLAEPEHIAEHAIRLAGPRTLAGKRVLVVNGATQEPIDAMRVVSNRSTGEMGFALAREAFRLGADVDVWFAHGEAAPPAHLHVERFSTLGDLVAKSGEASRYDAILVPAALSDFAPEPASGKISSAQTHVDLRMRALPKAIDALRAATRALIVPFKAEGGVSRDALVDKARSTLERVSAPFVVGNLLDDVTRGATRAVLVDRTSATDVEGDKPRVARAILDRLAKELAR